MATVLESVNDFDEQPMSQREKELVHQVRVMLKDLPEDTMRSLNTLVEENRGERWSDTQIMVYLNQAVADINAEPPHTQFQLESFPEEWKACIINGAVIFALIAEGILQNGEQFSYSDNGISLSVNLSQGYQNIASTLLNSYTQLKKDIKRAWRPRAAGVSNDAPSVRIRSYAPRMWTYR
jgi:hypothetical protein